jgi:hypothetical protein
MIRRRIMNFVYTASKEFYYLLLDAPMFISLEHLKLPKLPFNIEGGEMSRREIAATHHCTNR